MILYHGSNVIVERPRILSRLRALDFGAGFYTTSSLNQAQKWSKSVVKRTGNGKSFVSVYELIDSVLDELNVLRFASASEDWLDFVVTNRKKLPLSEKHDLVIGPVANDSTLPVIDDYMRGVFTKAYAIERLLPQKLTDQFAFLTEKAIGELKFVEALEVK